MCMKNQIHLLFQFPSCSLKHFIKQLKCMKYSSTSCFHVQIFFPREIFKLFTEEKWQTIDTKNEWEWSYKTRNTDKGNKNESKIWWKEFLIMKSWWRCRWRKWKRNNSDILYRSVTITILLFLFNFQKEMENSILFYAIYGITAIWKRIV